MFDPDTREESTEEGPDAHACNNKNIAINTQDKMRVRNKMMSSKESDQAECSAFKI